MVWFMCTDTKTHTHKAGVIFAANRCHVTDWQLHYGSSS